MQAQYEPPYDRRRDKLVLSDDGSAGKGSFHAQQNEINYNNNQKGHIKVDEKLVNPPNAFTGNALNGNIENLSNNNRAGSVISSDMMSDDD